MKKTINLQKKSNVVVHLSGTILNINSGISVKVFITKEG